MTEKEFLPFCLPDIGQEEIDEVVDSLRSGWITTGKKCKAFENAMQDYLGCKHVIALNSCTAALHTVLVASGIKEGDEVITTPLTFPATVNTILHAGGTPVLADIDPVSGNIDPENIMKKINHKTKALVPVHYAGLPCSMNEIDKIAKEKDLLIIEDAAHAIGACYNGMPIGRNSFAACYSFYPIKNMTTIEGGLVATNDASLAERIRCYSLHGMTKTAWNRYSKEGGWFYEIIFPGYKYNMTDIQAAVGLGQLKKLEGFIQKRHLLAATYKKELASNPHLILPAETTTDGMTSRHAWHLYVIRVRSSSALQRDELIEKLREEGIGTTVNFIPIPLHPYYREHLKMNINDYPMTRDFYKGAISIPLYPRMSEKDALRVTEAINRLTEAQ